MSSKLKNKTKKKNIIKEIRQNSNDTCIQCPDCGNLFIYTVEREIFCKFCNRVFSESEIRARCGL